MINIPISAIFLNFRREPEIFELSHEGRIVGVVVLDPAITRMFPAYTIWPNVLTVKEMDVHEILDFKLLPTKPTCQGFLEMLDG